MLREITNIDETRVTVRSAKECHGTRQKKKIMRGEKVRGRKAGQVNKKRGTRFKSRGYQVNVKTGKGTLGNVLVSTRLTQTGRGGVKSRGRGPA